MRTELPEVLAGAAAAGEQQRRQRLVRRVLERMMNAKLSAAFNRWATFAGEMKHSRVVVKRCLAKLRNRALAAAFARWAVRNNFGEDVKKLIRFVHSENQVFFSAYLWPGTQDYF